MRPTKSDKFSSWGFVNGIRRRPYSSGTNDSPAFEIDCKDALAYRLNLQRKLQVHEGCVNTINWDSLGNYLLSGSDDLHLVISDPFASRRSEVVTKLRTPHRSNIFSAEFFPDTYRRVISASCDGLVCLTDLDAAETERFTLYECHSGTVYDVHTLREEPAVFLTCSEDGTLRQFDLRDRNIRCSCASQRDAVRRPFFSRQRTRCNEHVTIDCRRPITAFAVSPTQGYLLGLAVSDGSIRLYDRRMCSACALTASNASNGTGCGAEEASTAMRGLVSRFVPPGSSAGARSGRITSVQFAPDGRELLASYFGANLYLISVTENCTERESTRILEELRQQVLSAPLTEPQQDSAPAARRIRLRGDWSDTGPSAVPEADRRGPGGEAVPQPDARDRILDHFSELLTRFFEARVLSTSNAAASTNSLQTQDANQPQSQSQSHDTRYANDASNVQLGAAGPSNSTGSSNMQGASAEDAAANKAMESSRSDSDDDESESNSNSEDDSDEKRRAELKRCARAFRERRQRDAAYVNRLGMLKPLRWYTGHRNNRTMIKKATFWGDRHIISGSDCGHVFIWDRHTAAIVGVLEADRHVVNCLQPHPHFPLLATSGIDYDIKLWSPSSNETCASREQVAALADRNSRMLRETAETLTMPPALVIRMLAAMRDSRLRAAVSTRRDADTNASAASNNDNNQDEA